MKTMITIYRDPCSDLVAYRTVERDASGRVIGEARGDIAHLAHLGEALASADEVDTSGLSVSDVAHDLPVARATIVDLTRITRWMAVECGADAETWEPTASDAAWIARALERA